ncbi:Uridylate kinase [Candidatus Lokiarchaeum ossiferum]|uniref:Uridylate kinase n=1 Tax=Candidatus Lokiarchaeum ossiferum TaxID=2951803 RepID=A0ABY6HV60_9ARCH|nr:Uridylate kinase [Candidatus Lokiarchaeum sp. B-35]
MSNKRILLKVGGSLLFDKNLEIREEIVKNFAQILKNAKSVVSVVVGGGKIARTYINAARALDAGESLCDTFGIEVSRLNARLLIAALEDKAYPEPITNLKEARSSTLWNKILVAGGFVPGQSTTSVTFEMAEALKATDVLILTNVDGIYDKDPNKFPTASKFDEIGIKKLEEVIYGEGGSSQSAAGEYRIFDAVSLQILKRSRLAVRLINGEKFEELKQLLVEEDFENLIGTKILHSL